MKILFLSEGGPTQDYLRDCVAHGMRTLFGPDFVDVRRLDSMYQGADRAQMYGKGFTLYGLLPDIEVDRTDIPRKISRRYFDLVIYGSIHRHQDFLHEVASQYRAPQVIFIDGEDHPGYLSGLGGITFKRELYNPQPGCFPIQFAIPAEKILASPPPKSRLMAPCDPLRRSTYVYATEESYYAQYAESYYAPTMKKAGWDCLRHYEVLSQWTLPYFRCFEQLPPTIAQFLPRAELRLVQQAIEVLAANDGAYDLLRDLWSALIDPCMDALRAHMTTEKLATYILDTIGVRAKETVLCA